MDLKNKKVAVIGAGVEGLSTLEFLTKKGVEVYLLDQKNQSNIEGRCLDKIKKLGVKGTFGDNYLDGLNQFDVIVRSPGVHPTLPQLAQARSKGVEITSQTKLFFEMCPVPIIGVTGTKGKGTTSTLIYEILKAAGKKVFLGGNIGKPPLDFIDQVTNDSLVVLELSSFQLIDLEKSPHIAVVLMIANEHQDWHGSVNEYLKAKENVVRHQRKDDFVIINADFASSKKLGELSAANKYYFSTYKPVERGSYVDKDFIVSVTNGWTTIAQLSDIKIPGEHNLQNICAAVAVSGVLEISPSVVQKAVTSFKGLSHRLEFVAEKGGARFYNDSASTIPETATAAIKSFKNPKILILGGSSKKSDFTQLVRTIAEEDVKAVILIGEEAGRIKESIHKSGRFSGQIIEDLKDMKDVVEKAHDSAKKGDVVLLSPGCASFDMFTNYKDRGDQFKRAVFKIS